MLYLRKSREPLRVTTLDNINLILKQYIIDEFLAPRGQTSLDPDYQLFEEGLIDSLGLIILSNFIEEQFNIKLQSEEIILENFATLEIMSALVTQKVQERAST